jgi:hypothetical protein
LFIELSFDAHSALSPTATDIKAEGAMSGANGTLGKPDKDSVAEGD